MFSSPDLSPFFSTDFERLLESRPLLSLRERERLLSLDLERERGERERDREDFFALSGLLDFDCASRDLDRDLERDFDRLLLRDLDLLLDLEDDRERLPPRPRPRSSTNRIRRPFSSVSSNFSTAAFKSE